ncbi:MAG: hypothetical protein AMJ91_00225 [candidate division Zixibacteria bacterium SM23_73_3]|nr:MAG: hypothetical protein AMJ91_00225 [candidate division Zixibacteria bacterium SM23_73_3]
MLLECESLSEGFPAYGGGLSQLIETMMKTASAPQSRGLRQADVLQSFGMFKRVTCQDSWVY